MKRRDFIKSALGGIGAVLLAKQLPETPAESLPTGIDYVADSADTFHGLERGGFYIKENEGSKLWYTDDAGIDRRIA